MPEASPFTINVADDVLIDLRERLLRTRWPGDFANDDWAYGVSETYMREVVDYWLNGYDWRAQERAANQYRQFMVEIEGAPIHFVYEKGKGPNPIPIILTHGWPETFWEYNQMIGPLTDPARYGGDERDAFDLILPDLPGYGFSSPLTRPGVSPQKTADLWDTLMRGVLGYERYGLGGGDWGAIVSGMQAHKYGDHIIGLHFTMPSVPGVALNTLTPADYGPGEGDWHERMTTRMIPAASHVTVNRLDPQTLAYSWNDSPVGLASWLIERRRNFGDTNGNVESRFSKDFMLTTTMMFWVTQSFGTASRYYWEHAHDPWRPVHNRKPVIEVPTGFAVFPKELLFMPRAVAARETNLVHWSLMPEGGHYGPSEAPAHLVEDLRLFFRRFR
ncbi:MAG: epoxide hydrolase family protein [Dehalococcoidia bacterium]